MIDFHTPKTHINKNTFTDRFTELISELNILLTAVVIQHWKFTGKNTLRP